MSVLTDQCDKLRESANMADGIADGLANQLRDAADTIDGLRERLHLLLKDNAKFEGENDELRELIRDMWRVLEYTNKCYSENDGFSVRIAEMGIKEVDNDNE